MTKTKSTKRALLTSALSLLLCISMLVGTTFAWFTDSVTSGRNVIQSGNLDVELYYAASADDVAADKWTKVTDSVDVFGSNLWEPGFTQIAYFKVVNEGSLALKYQLTADVYEEKSGINKAGEVFYLSDSLKYGVVDNLDFLKDRATAAAAATNDFASFTLNSVPLAKGESDVIGMVITMPTTVGNEANHNGVNVPEIGFGIKLLATQNTVESDSFDNQYDKMATIDSLDEFDAALAGDYDVIALGADLVPTENIVIPAGKKVTIDLAGHSISKVRGDLTTAFALIDNKGELTIKDSVGAGKVSFADTTPYTADNGFASNTIRNTGTLTIAGGTVENLTPAEVTDFSYPHAIDVYQGSVTNITGGTVKSANYDCIRMFCNSATLATTVNISGGTIYNRVSFQDPATNVAGYGVLNISGGNFVSTDDVTANVRLLNFCKVSNNMKATVSGGTFDKGFLTQDYSGVGNITNADWVTFVGVTPVTPADTPAELKDAMAEGGKVVLTKDVSVTETMNVPADKTAIIDLNGNDISYAVSNSGASAIIANKGELSIVGEGTISFVAANPDLGAIPAYATNTITNTGSLTIGEGVVVTNGSEGGASYAVDNHGKFVLDGGTLIGDRCALRIAKYNQDDVQFTMNSGLVKAKTPAWIQLPGSSSSAAPKITVKINGGTMETTKPSSFENDVMYTYSYGNSHINTSITINGGNFIGGVVSIGSGYKGDVPTLTINGGKFDYDVLQWLAGDSSTVLYYANN